MNGRFNVDDYAGGSGFTSKGSHGELSTPTSAVSGSGVNDGDIDDQEQEDTPTTPPQSAAAAPQHHHHPAGAFAHAATTTHATNTQEEQEHEVEQMDDELQADREVFESLFSTRKPKDGWAGLSSGLKSVAKGTAAGVASLIAAPIAGASTDGVRGFMTGLATGVASCVALPVTGVCVGAYQVGRGLANSGEAIRATQAGMLWDEERREWYYYLLDREAAQLQQQEEQLKSCASGGNLGGGGTMGGGSERKVKDREYYDLLGVSTNATNVDLKKAYYKRSREVHPDRNPNDPEAAKKFQALSHAYQVLCNEQARAYYDKNGKSESSDSQSEMQLADIDPYVFFAVMFGSEAVRPYIGELWIANKADSLMKDQSLMMEFQNAQAAAEEDGVHTSSPKIDEEVLKQNALRRTQEEIWKQKKREVDCAVHLRDKVQPYVDGSYDESEFVALCQEEAALITKASFGDIFCTAIGYALEVEATEFIGSHASFLGFEGQAARIKKKGYSFQNQMKILGAGISAARAGSQAYKEMDRLQKEAQEARNGNGGGSDNADGEEGGAADDGGAAASSASDKKPQQSAAAASGAGSSNNRERMKQATEKIEQSLPAFLEFAWAINIQDITRTLKHVCDKLFHDGAEILPLEIRLKRAEAVRLLGREFYTMGHIAKKTSFTNIDAQELRTRAEVAAMTTLAKAQGQEIDDKDAEEMIRQARQMEAAQKQRQQQNQ